MKNKLIDLIKLFLKEYKYENDYATKDLKQKYNIDSEMINEIFDDASCENIILKVGIGSGRLAKCPYIVLMDKRITSKPTYGIYIVIIFKEDMSGFYLMINQGVSLINLSDKDYQLVRNFWCDKLGISHNKVNISLSPNPTGIVLEYQKAYIISDSFEANFDSEQLKEKLRTYLEYYDKISNTLSDEFKYNLESMYNKITNKDSFNSILSVAQSIDVNKEKNDSELRDLFLKSLSEDANKSKGIVFFLGAGVSASVGAPDWNNLVFKLLRNKWELELDNLSQDDVKKYVKDYTSPTVLAALVKNMYNEENNDKFIEDMHDVCYENEVVDEDLKDSPLGYIAKMAIQRRSKVEAIITYNYDDYLERTMRTIGGEEEFICIYEKSQSKIEIGNKLPIYHVHGYIPQYDYKDNNSYVILTEKEYHELYSDSYNWTNIIQTKYLMDYTCVFLGLSFSDTNQRRLLERVCGFKPENNYNYIIMGNKIPDEKNLQECDKVLNEINKLWNEKNYKLKTLYINKNSYEEINKDIISLLKEITDTL